jgi:hypothetical protein
MLQSFGITGDEIPISWSGTVKLTNIKKWMRMRILLEKQVPYNELYYDAPSAASSLTTSTLTSLNTASTTTVGVNTPTDATYKNTNTNNMKMIECPYLNDVVFRQGTSANGNPGNVTFRSMIESKLNADNSSISNNSKGKNNTSIIVDETNGKTTIKTNKIKTKRIVYEIMDYIKNNNNGRVLIWNNKGWWDVLMNEEHVYLKIEYIVREIRNTIIKKKRMAASAISENKINQINLNSGTSIFQSQDGITNVTIATTNRIKRQRLNNCSHANDSSDDDGDDSIVCNINTRIPETQGCAAVCFGMKFMAW